MIYLVIFQWDKLTRKNLKKVSMRRRWRQAVDNSVHKSISGTKKTTSTNDFIVEVIWIWKKIWSGKRDSNSRPRPWQGRALPTELFPLGCVYCDYFQILERETRLELATPTLARSCSTNWAIPAKSGNFCCCRNSHFCFVTGGALYENSFPLQPPLKRFFKKTVQVLDKSASWLF